MSIGERRSNNEVRKPAQYQEGRGRIPSWVGGRKGGIGHGCTNPRELTDASATVQRYTSVSDLGE